MTVYVTPGPRPLPLVRNPLLSLPELGKLRELPEHVRVPLRALLMDIRRASLARAETEWRRHKSFNAAYYKVIGVYAGHMARALR